MNIPKCLRLSAESCAFLIEEKKRNNILRSQSAVVDFLIRQEMENRKLRRLRQSPEVQRVIDAAGNQ